MNAILQHHEGTARAPRRAPRTTAVPFHHIPSDGGHLFQIQPDMDPDNACTEADILTEFVRRRLETAMNDCDDMHVEIHRDDVYTMVTLLEMVKALRLAVGPIA